MSMKMVRGTGNVFADLGLPDAVDRQTKARLAIAINAIIEARGLKQIEAGRILAIPQPKVSALANYRLDGFSVERLMGFLTALDQDVQIMIRPSSDSGEGQVSVHMVP